MHLDARSNAPEVPRHGDEKLGFSGLSCSESERHYYRGVMFLKKTSREELLAHETARYRDKGLPNAEHRAERSCNAWEELTARVGLRRWQRPPAIASPFKFSLLFTIQLRSHMQQLSFTRSECAARVALIRKNLPLNPHGN